MPRLTIVFAVAISLLPIASFAAVRTPNVKGTGHPTHATRAAVVRALADSLERAPGRADLWLALGHACVESGMSDRARQAFERASRCAGVDPMVWLELARAWRRDWLYSGERASLDSASWPSACE